MHRGESVLVAAGGRQEERRAVPLRMACSLDGVLSCGLVICASCDLDVDQSGPGMARPALALRCEPQREDEGPAREGS